MAGKYTIGLDYGTNSVRALIVDVVTGEEIATSTWNYAHGQAGIVLDSRDPLLARQHPRDYLDGIEHTILDALKQASSRPGFNPSQVVGIGVDTTGSTPLPVDASGQPLAFKPAFANDPAALVASHAPFTWGNTPAKALENAIVLEAVAKMELETYLINPQAPAIPSVLLDKHFLRKHGPTAYYGQKYPPRATPYLCAPTVPHSRHAAA